MLEFLFNKVAAINFIKKRFQYRCFPVNIAKFSGALILKNICQRLLFLTKQFLPKKTFQDLSCKKYLFQKYKKKVFQRKINALARRYFYTLFGKVAFSSNNQHRYILQKLFNKSVKKALKKRTLRSETTYGN